jgi:hypothetical protein
LVQAFVKKWWVEKEHVLIDWTEDQLSINTQSDETDIMTLHCQLDID